MIRAHKIRLNPTPEQELYFRKAAGTKRFVFNWGLARWIEAKQEGIEKCGPMELKEKFNSIKGELFPWVYDVAKDVCEGAFKDLGVALKNRFESKSGNRKGIRVGFPKFKSKHKSKQSFRLNNDKFWVDGHTIYIPRLGEVNLTEPLRFAGKIMGAVVSKVSDWWFISIQVEMAKPAPISFPKESIGVDVGVKTLAVLSDGSTFENQKPLRSQRNRLRKLNRSLARRKKGSGRWRKTKQKLGRFHYRVDCKRRDAHHKASLVIAKSAKLIGIEDLHVKGMMQNRKLSLSFGDAGVGELLRQIQYKSEAFGGVVVKVGRFFASSKICHDCGYVNRDLELKDRQWVCLGCGTIRERDWNAARNIEQEALRLAYA